MRHYEIMIILHGTLDEATVQQTTERITGLIGELDGRVDEGDHWGKREFAYEIDHMHEGWYVVIDYHLPPSSLNELERRLRLTDGLVRYMNIRPESRVRRVS